MGHFGYSPTKKKKKEKACVSEMVTQYPFRDMITKDLKGKVRDMITKDLKDKVCTRIRVLSQFRTRFPMSITGDRRARSFRSTFLMRTTLMRCSYEVSQNSRRLGGSVNSHNSPLLFIRVVNSENS